MGRTHETFKEISSGYEHVETQNLRYHFYHHLGGNEEKMDPKQPIDSGEIVDTMTNLDEEIPAAEAQSWKAYHDLVASGDMINSQKALSNALSCMKMRHDLEDTGRG